MCESPSNSPLSWLLLQRLLREGTLDWLEELWGELAEVELLETCEGGLSPGNVGGGRKCRGRGSYLLSGVSSKGKRLWWLGQFGQNLVPRAKLFGRRLNSYSSRATAHGGRGKEFGKPINKPFGFLVNGECSWGGGGREGGSGGGSGSGELGGVDRTTGACNSHSVSGVLHRCSMTR